MTPPATNPNEASTVMTMTTGIQKGERTQSHDQLMTPVSFRTMKEIPSRPAVSTPADFVVFSIVLKGVAPTPEGGSG